jgi:hypothetical protein
MPRTGFETAIVATKRQQTYALDRAATGIDYNTVILSPNDLIHRAPTQNRTSDSGEINLFDVL